MQFVDIYVAGSLFGLTVQKHRSYGTGTVKMILINLGCYEIQNNTRGQNHLTCWSLEINRTQYFATYDDSLRWMVAIILDKRWLLFLCLNHKRQRAVILLL
jgi:hypothetical protein